MTMLTVGIQVDLIEAIRDLTIGDQWELLQWMWTQLERNGAKKDKETEGA